MVRITGSADAPLLECTNPVRDLWRIRWDYQTDSEGNTSYMEHQFSHKPSRSEVAEVIHNWVNANVDNTILTGFYYEEAQVWLSVENQLNYKGIYDLAVQTNGSNLPVTLKFGDDDSPVYRTFFSVDDLSDFYVRAISFIREHRLVGVG